MEIRKYLDRLLFDSPDVSHLNLVYSTPISCVSPHGCEEPLALDEIHRLEIDPESWMSLRARKYQGPYPPYSHENVPWLHDLREVYADRRLIDGHICPHQGTDLLGFVPDDGGVVTCPLHGLR
ncbi:MAG: hypothetical protein OXF79_21050 [Chloroflexi bacterium]|nr:hypothetical protein [Chloroflexota bacterium]